MKKTSHINILVEPDVKRKILEKATALNLSITKYFEKVAKEDIIFLDENVKKIKGLFDLKEK